MMSESQTETQNLEENQNTEIPKPQDSFVKLAMRNMVRKKATSLKHLFLTVSGLLAFLIGISYLTR